MEIIESLSEMTEWSERVRDAHQTIGFVPTMGSLHAGHMSLVRESVSASDKTVVSIFINPTQFGKNEDLGTYPQDLGGDKHQLESAGVDVLFLPTRKTMYPEGYKTFVEVEEITGHLCGKSRPGFFRGVATIVLKLFNIVRPHTSFFGDKDWQQATVVETLVRDLNLDVAIQRLPIVREPEGLAKSSRNLYLADAEKVPARSLSKALEMAQHLVKDGETSANTIREEIRQQIGQYKEAEIDYISICDPENFVEHEEIKDKSLIALAVRIGATRLIDNCIVRRVKCRK